MLFNLPQCSFVPPNHRFASLLLLHLLEVNEWSGDIGRLLSTLDENGPVFRDGHFTIESGSCVFGLNMNCYIEFARGLASEYSMSGGNVGVVASDSGTDMPVVGDEIIRGIEPDPAEVRDQYIKPSVTGIGGGAVMVFAAAVEVAGDVSCRDPDVAKQGDHGVSEILTDTAAVGDCFVNGRVHAGGARHVFEVLKEALVELLDELEGIVAAGDVELAGEMKQRGGLGGELTRQNELPVVT